MAALRSAIGAAVGCRAARITLKALLVLLASGIAAYFFGICVPFFLLGMHLIPSLGVGGVVYVGAGGLAGLLFAGVTTTVSLARSDRLFTRYYAVLTVSLLVLTGLCLAGYFAMPERFAHI